MSRRPEQRAPASKVTPEAKALARRRSQAGNALLGGSDLPPDEQVAMLKVLCRRLWRLLDRRREGGTTPEQVWSLLSVEMMAAVDRTFEAAMVLFARDGIHVEPCRRPTSASFAGTPYFLLVMANGDTRVVREADLLMMADVAAA